MAFSTSNSLVVTRPTFLSQINIFSKTYRSVTTFYNIHPNRQKNFEKIQKKIPPSFQNRVRNNFQAKAFIQACSETK